jgi:hypothetical protein
VHVSVGEAKLRGEDGRKGEVGREPIRDKEGVEEIRQISLADDPWGGCGECEAGEELRGG